MVKAKDRVTAEAAMKWLAEYDPGPVDTDRIWPPPVRCRSWDNQTLPDAIHYAIDDVKQIFRIVMDHDLGAGEILVTDFRNGLPCLLWGQLFARVVSIVSHKSPEHEPIIDGNQTILFGRPADTRFLYRAIEQVGNLKMVL